uniref:Semaphorin 3D n=1 Tax=Gopherus evgoodei TaxID=1825980 RepID=A0A8C4WAI1_9SAUR
MTLGGPNYSSCLSPVGQPAVLTCGTLCSLGGNTRAGLPEATSLPLLCSADLLTSNSSHLLLGSGDGLAFQSFLVDETGAWLMVGAKNHIFLLGLQGQDLEHKGLGQWCWRLKEPFFPEQTECANFIRLLQPFNRSHVFVCGTGSYQPICPGGSPIQLVANSVESGRGKCPFSPHEPFTGSDGELYSGTSSDFMGSSAAFFRTRVHKASQNYIRTEQNQDHWLNEPVFIGAYVIPDTHNAHDDKVYIFLRETALEAGQWERRRIHARVARVCKNDVGGKRSLINRWSTFLKARLVCSIPGPQASETHFDQLEDIFLLRTRDPQSPLIFGLFTVSSGIFSGSAVCVYSMADMRAAFSGPFAHKEGADYRWVEYKGRIPYPRPGTCPSETYDPLLHSTKDFPDDLISFMRNHQLMWGPVYPLGRKPILMRANVPYRLRQLLVDRVETESGHYDVLFLGTDEGKVLKVGLTGGRGQDSEEISLEEISVSKVPIPPPLGSLLQQELFVSSTHGLVQLSLYRCELYGKDCADCCLARDPYCTWDGKGCSPYRLTEKRQARCQDALKTDPVSQCQDTTAEVIAAEEKLVFGVENNSTFLECLARSPQTAIRWLVQRSREVRTGDRFSILEQGLLIRQLAREDAGVYQCQAVEHSFSRPLMHYSLRVIGHEAMGAKQSKGAEEGGSHLSAMPVQLQYKGYPRNLGAPGTSLDEYCNVLRHQDRQRQKAWNPKWQQHPLESKKGRVRRHPDPLKPARAGLRLV